MYVTQIDPVRCAEFDAPAVRLADGPEGVLDHAVFAVLRGVVPLVDFEGGGGCHQRGSRPEQNRPFISLKRASPRPPGTRPAPSERVERSRFDAWRFDLLPLASR